jgi:hypothetical protein
MRPALSRRRATVLFAGILTTAAAGYAVHASADTTTYSVSGCSASLLQLSIGGNAIPIPSASCPDDGDVFVPPIDVPLDPGDSVHAQVLYEYAAAAPDAGRHNAEAGVAKLVVTLQGHVISADVLTSHADCSSGQASGESQVVDLNLDGNQLIVPDTFQQPHHLLIDQLSPVATIDMNRQDTSSSTHTTTTAAGTTVTTTRSLTQTALEVKALIDTPLEVDLVVAQSHVDCATAVFTPTTTPPPPASVDWMTGGGQVGSGSSTATHSLVLPCTLAQSHPGPHLGVVYKNKGTHQFTLTSATSLSCSLDPKAGSPAPPDADFNTLTGQGNGTCDGLPAHVSFTFTDSGEPGTSDTASITISSSSSGGCSLSLSGPVANGDQQAHTGHNPPASPLGHRGARARAVGARRCPGRR